LIVCHDRRGWVENYKFKNGDHQHLREDAVPQHTPRDRITINFGHDIGKNIDKRKVVNGNGQGNPHYVNQLTGGGNANDGEKDVAKNNVVQEFIVLHLLAR
jgi:hypothetical protein